MSGTGEEQRPPYKLFDYYTFEDRDLFFGREEEVLRTVGEVLTTRLLVLFAPSGSGKSSLINAGVRPKLEERGFYTVTVRLDCLPDVAIKRRLRRDLPQFFADLSDDTDLHASLAAAYRPKQGAATPQPLVVFLDQFEEFFVVFADQPQIRRAFIEEIARIKFDNTLPVYVVLSLRDDYFVCLNEFREAIPSIFQNNANIQLRPLDDGSALRAVIEPASKVGLRYEDGLPERIIADLKNLRTMAIPEGGRGVLRGVDVATAQPTEAPVARELKPGSSSENGSPSPGTNEGEKSARVGPQTTNGAGVLPITLQIVCYTLWLRRPPAPQPQLLTFELYQRLGGAATIIRNQLDSSLRQLPRGQQPLMRRLFRVLMTADLTKRLRSLDDLAEILRIRDRGKLTAVLENLTKANILREEHTENQAWYEFRHDYLVKELQRWLAQFDNQVRRRRLTYATVFGLIPVLVLGFILIIGFFTYQVNLTPKDYKDQEAELQVVRRWNPLGFRITTGILASQMKGFDAENRLRDGFRLSFGHLNDWHEMTNLLCPAGLATLTLKIIDERLGAALVLSDPQYTEKSSTTNLSALVRIEPEFARLVLELVNDPDWTVRLGVAETFAGLGRADTIVLRPLLKLLDDPNPLVRQSASKALGTLSNPDRQIVERLRLRLKDPDDSVRVHVAEALIKLNDRDPLVVTVLMASLREGWPSVRPLAAKNLVTLGRSEPTVVDGLLGLLGEKDPSVRVEAAQALRELGNKDPRVVRVFLTVLDKTLPFSPSRKMVLEALTELGRGDASVAERLLPLLKAPDLLVRMEAAEVFGKMNRSTAPVVEALVDLLKINEVPLQVYAIEALGKLGNTNQPVVEALLPLVDDEHSSIRTSAAKALGKLGENNDRVTDGIAVLVEHGSPAVLRNLKEALRKLSRMDQAVSEGLLALLTDSSAVARRSAAEALGRLGRTDTTVLDSLVARLKDPASPVRLSATEALGRLRLPEPRVVDSLLGVMQNSDAYLQKRAASALGELGKPDDRVITALLANLEDTDSLVQESSAEALGKLHRADESVTKGLVACLNNKNASPSVRKAVTKALTDLGAAGRPVLDGLAALLKDGNQDIQRSASDALGKLGQQRSDWTDERLIEILQHDVLNSHRRTAGLVLAHRPNLKTQSLEKIRSLRHDQRPWVRMAAWDTLLEIQRIRDRSRQQH